MELLSILLGYLFFSDKNMSECLRDKELCAPAGPGDQEMDWYKAQPQCQLNGIAACIRFGLYKCLNEHKKMG